MEFYGGYYITFTLLYKDTNNKLTYFFPNLNIKKAPSVLTKSAFKPFKYPVSKVNPGKLTTHPGQTD
jgi:hypothetical protein